MGGYITSSARSFYVVNDNGVAAPNAPPANAADNFRGKQFLSLVRGVIVRLSIYCKRTAAGTITLSYAPKVGDAAVGTATITPGADWGWVEAALVQAWNYDTLFVWISAIGADCSYGYDTGADREMFYSEDGGATWKSHTVNRLFIRALICGRTGPEQL